jgi:pimeloyl-ACP methyl ester carboxylesterase
MSTAANARCFISRTVRAFPSSASTPPVVKTINGAGCSKTRRSRATTMSSPTLRARHGKSEPPLNKEWWKEEYRLTADHYVNFIVAFCDALELKTPIFMGSSFGGNVALQLALRKPDCFRAVIPVEGAAHAPGFFLDVWRHPHANAAQVCASGVWDLMAPQSTDRDRWLTWRYYTQGSEAFRGDLYFYSVDHDLRDSLGKIDTRRCPVVMMTGTYDYLTPPKATEKTASGIPGGVYIEMEDIGHFPMGENYPVFRVYLKEALRIIAEKAG